MEQVPHDDTFETVLTEGPAPHRPHTVRRRSPRIRSEALAHIATQEVVTSPEQEDAFTDEIVDDSDKASDLNQIDLDEAASSADLVRVYLNEIGKVPLLTAVEEVEIAKRIELGLLIVEVRKYREKLKKSPEEFTQFRDALEQSIRTAKTGVQFKDEPELAVAEVQKTIAVIERLAADEHNYPSGLLRALEVDGGRAKDHLLRANLRLVVSLAKRYTGRGLSFLDLTQEGNLGLVRAVEKFDYTKGFKFSTYATWWIRQAISRALADQSRTIRLPVHLVEQVNKLQRIRRELNQELGHAPSATELSQEMDLPEPKILELSNLTRDTLSLDETVGEDGDATLGDFITDEITQSIEEQVENIAKREMITEVLDTLTHREAAVVRMRFGLDDGQAKTLDEIGEHFNLSRERIRQIERETMSKLRHPSRSQVLRDFLDS